MDFNSISYAVTASTEYKELERLLAFLRNRIRPQDEVVLQLDSSSASCKVKELAILMEICFNKSDFIQVPSFKTINFPLNNNFSDFKNNLKEHCSKEYIFQIDADEIPSVTLIDKLPRFLQGRKDLDLIHVARVNTVNGLTPSHVSKWNWNINKKGYVNWPDWQPRIFKNLPVLRWHLPVHETIINYTNAGFLPDLEGWSLHHHKEIEKQERQNNFYSTIISQ